MRASAKGCDIAVVGHGDRSGIAALSGTTGPTKTSEPGASAPACGIPADATGAERPSQAAGAPCPARDTESAERGTARATVSTNTEAADRVNENSVSASTSRRDLSTICHVDRAAVPTNSRPSGTAESAKSGAASTAVAA